MILIPVHQFITLPLLVLNLNEVCANLLSFHAQLVEVLVADQDTTVVNNPSNTSTQKYV